MANDIEISVNDFQSELFSIIDGFIWKDKFKADALETKEYSREVDQFIAAHRNLLTFDSIFQFDAASLNAAGLHGEDMLNAAENKYLMNSTQRRLAEIAYVNSLLAKDPVTGRYINYEEKNNYYRMLYGLPNVGDTDFVYNTKYEDIDMTTPVHLLDTSIRYTLEERGYFAELLEQYPDKKYLNHQASKMIDPYVSRTAQRFDILWMNTAETVNLGNAFRDCYDNCRSLVVRTYYRPDMGKSNEMYEGFIGMCILFMTLNLMFYKYLEADTTRDFFDVESLRHVYDSYGVPFYPSIPISLHKQIVKNINILLSYKGSTKVFYKLFDLFGYGHMDIYEFYLLKTHKMNSDGTPHFAYKEDGSLDKSAMYEIKFGQVRLYDNPPLELSNTKNHQSYTSMVSADPYWVSDSALMDKLMDEKFNYLDTKYLGIRTMFDMMAIVYESSYFFKLLLDNREALDKTMIFYGATNQFYNIFDLTIYIICVICKKHGYDGIISGNLPSVSKILGFNFKADIAAIRQDILNDLTLKDDTELIDAITYMNVNSLASINSTFAKIMDLRKLIFDRMWKAKTIEAYDVYKRLYQTLCTSDIIDSVYTKRDGTIATTFMDLLNDISADLYIRLNGEGIDLDEELDSLFILYEKSFSELQYIKYADGIDMGVLMEQLFLLLKFFKSAKAELTGYDIVYCISYPEANFIKWIGEIVGERHETQIDDKFHWMTDILLALSEDIVFADKFFKLKDQLIHLFDKGFFDDWFDKLTDELFKDISIIKDKQGMLDFIDYVNSLVEKHVINDVLDMSDCMHLFSEDIMYDTVEMKLDDSILTLLTVLHIIEEKTDYIYSDLNFKDRMMDIIENIVECIDKYTTVLPFISDLRQKDEYLVKSQNLTWDSDIAGVTREGTFISVLDFHTAITEVKNKFSDLYTHLQMVDSIHQINENSTINDTTALFHDTLHLIYEDKFEE